VKIKAIRICIEAVQKWEMGGKGVRESNERG
jgi:hypothetical protein